MAGSSGSSSLSFDLLSKLWSCVELDEAFDVDASCFSLTESHRGRVEGEALEAETGPSSVCRVVEVFLGFVPELEAVFLLEEAVVPVLAEAETVAVADEEEEVVAVAGGGSLRFGGRPRLRLTGGSGGASLFFVSTFGSGLVSFGLSSIATGDFDFCLRPPLFFLFLRIGSSANSTEVFAVLDRVLGLRERSTDDKLDFIAVGELSGPDSDRVRGRWLPPFFFSEASLSSSPPPVVSSPALVASFSPELSCMALAGGAPAPDASERNRFIPTSVT